ncbi:hypothetical protein ACQP1P_10245 [Dactylosporangium sp. CA-052675]|uniref:hypothetical protein n=1 Tax=Dactylosporangium sp. CA-052675 TaxID=3239927 RepID=UPI003D931B7F
MIEQWATSHRTRARFMLMLDPQARRELGESAARLADGFVDRAEALTGSRQRGRLLIGLIDGLLLDEVIRGTVTAEERRDRLDAVRRIVAAEQ